MKGAAEFKQRVMSGINVTIDKCRRTIPGLFRTVLPDLTHVLMMLRGGMARNIVLVCLVMVTVPVIAEVNISLSDSAAKDNVRLHLSLAREKCTAPEWKVRRLFAKAEQEIDPAMRALGYYHAVVKKSLVFKKDCWQADFAVEQGPQVLVNDISIIITGEARNDPEFKKLRDRLIKTGAPLHHGQYEKMKRQIEALALERGYLKGTFIETKLLIDKQKKIASIRLEFDTGKRFYFGDVAVHQDILNPDFVEKYIAIKSDDYYDSGLLVETYNALSKSGYFEMVDIRPDTESGDQRVPVTITLTPKSRHHYSFGLGFDTDFGPLASASYANRRLNRRGHFFTSNIDISPVLSTVDAEYSIPLDSPVSDFFSLGAGIKNTDTDSFESKTAKLSARLKHDLDNSWKQTLFLDLSYEDFKTGTLSNKTLLLVPGGSWLRSVANDTLRPTKGHRVEISTSGSYKNPLSDVSFIQGALSAVWMHPLPWDGRFIGRTELGATLVDQFDKLPTSYRFYAGGMKSIRGYGYKELGPKDNLGNVIGGRFLTVVSAEYEQAIFEDWGIAAFIDTGNAFNAEQISLKTGAGLGVRWYSPIGPIRIDFALPLNEADSSFQIHFAAGGRL